MPPFEANCFCSVVPTVNCFVYCTECRVSIERGMGLPWI